jgi:hypothetical protein
MVKEQVGKSELAIRHKSREDQAGTNVIIRKPAIMATEALAKMRSVQIPKADGCNGALCPRGMYHSAPPPDAFNASGGNSGEDGERSSAPHGLMHVDRLLSSSSLPRAPSPLADCVGLLHPPDAKISWLHSPTANLPSQHRSTHSKKGLRSILKKVAL